MSMGAPLGLPARGRLSAIAVNVLALVTDAFGGIGGIARYNRDLLTALARREGANRIVVVPRLGSAETIALPPGVRQIGARGSKLRYAYAAIHAAASQGPYDVVFCGHLYMATLGATVARLLGIPLWLQLHGYEAWTPIAPTRRWAVNRASLITAVSRFTRRRFLHFNSIDPSRVRVLPNTVDARFAPGPKPDHLLERHHLRDKKVLLTVARLAPDERCKGHDTVMQALPALIGTHPDLVYLVAGTGDDRARLAELAQRLGIADKVLFVGLVAPDELADYYRLADVFVMPSTQEGFGIVFLEAAASGLKLIGGNRDGSVDALADGAIGFAIDPASPGELVRAIGEALAGRGPDPAQARRFRFENFTRQVDALTSSHLLHRGSRSAA
jgi:phosphatidyl-myo-inositol dimannoside synthase